MSELAQKKRPNISIRSAGGSKIAGTAVVNEKPAAAPATKARPVTVKTVKPSTAILQRPVSKKPVMKPMGAEPAIDPQDMDRTELQEEVARLRGLLADMRARNDIIDPVSGLPKRGRFLEMAGAEFNRTRRYNHNLTLVMASIAGYGRVFKSMGQEAADQVVTSVAEMCMSSTRYGVDILGRVGEDKIAMLLPETNIQGGQLCLERMRKLVMSMPIMINGEKVKVGLNVSARQLKDEHDSFLELLSSK